MTSRKRPGISTGALSHIDGKQNELKLAPYNDDNSKDDKSIKEQTKLAQNENYPKITSKGKAMFLREKQSKMALPL